MHATTNDVDRACILEQEQLASARDALLHLVDTFETNRWNQIAQRGAAMTAAYDTGIKHAVHEALDELDAGTYGRCVKCGDRIPSRRLIETPYARRCTTCQREELARWNDVERSFAAAIHQWVGEPQGATPQDSAGRPCGA